MFRRTALKILSSVPFLGFSGRKIINKRHWTGNLESGVFYLNSVEITKTMFLIETSRTNIVDISKNSGPGRFIIDTLKYPFTETMIRNFGNNNITVRYNSCDYIVAPKYSLTIMHKKTRFIFITKTYSY